MYRQLLNHSADLKKLENEGFEVEIVDKHLLVRNIPYVNCNKEIKRGTLVTTLNYSGEKTLKPETHIVFFEGEFPCNKEGLPIEQLRHQSNSEKHGDIATSHSFSNKPPKGFSDYYEKMISYINILSAPAFSIDKECTPKTWKPIKVSTEDSVFKYFDSNSSRAGISHLNNKFKKEKVGIIGTGGTGSYILDFVSKTEVQEIHLFDGDKFIHHNAFKAPGAASHEELAVTPFKTDYFANKYSNIRNNIFSHPVFLDETNVSLLSGLTFVFISIDCPVSKKLITDFLTTNKIMFIDVGMGINICDGKLTGTLRVTTGLVDRVDHIPKRISFADGPDDDYHTNIQIAELNALNAVFAVIKWKKLRGYIQDLEQELNTCYVLDGNQVTNDEKNSA